jgi:threonine/homoserine/homoserine lactone efflux protein
MLDLSTLAIFIGAALALLVTPGPAVMYIVAQSIDGGRIAGVASVLGIAFATFFHIGAAALGISAILMSSALAFSVVKYLGAAYLIYLGVRRLTERDTPLVLEKVERQPLRYIFRQGVVVNLLNPKTALFFFAFLPQFVDPARGAAWVQIVLLGTIFTTLAILSDGAYAMLAGTLGTWIRRSRGLQRGLKYFSGGVYITLGVATALGGRAK